MYVFPLQRNMYYVIMYSNIRYYVHQTLTHFYVMSAADSAHLGSAFIATTEHMPTQTLTEVEIRRTDGSFHTYTIYKQGVYIYVFYKVLFINYALPPTCQHIYVFSTSPGNEIGVFEFVNLA